MSLVGANLEMEETTRNGGRKTINDADVLENIHYIAIITDRIQEQEKSS